jgi:hypothetical protein
MPVRHERVDAAARPRNDARMSPMPPSVQRIIAAVGMVIAGAGAALLAFVSVLYEVFAFENTDPSEEPYELVAVASAAGLVTAIFGLGALVTGSRAWTRRAAIAQAVCAISLLVLFDAIGYFGIDPLLVAGLVTVIAVDALAVWASVLPLPEEATTAARTDVYGSWRLPAARMPSGIPRQVSIASMLAIATTGALAPLVEQAIGGAFNLRLAGGAGLLGIPAAVAVAGLATRSRQLAAGAAILQAITAALLLLLWDSPRWYAFEEYDREDTAFNLYLVGVLLADALLLSAALRRDP